MTTSPLSVQFNEVPGSRGWVVLAGEQTKAWAVAELEWHLHRSGLSTARVMVAAATSSEVTASQLREVGNWVQWETATTTPIQYSGVGAGAAAALRAATQSATAGALIGRGDRRGLASVPLAAAPTMVVVHLDEGRAARRRGRSAATRLGRHGRLAVLWGASDPVEAVRSWARAAEAGRWPHPTGAASAIAPRQVSNRWRIPAAVAVAGGSLLVSAHRAGAVTSRLAHASAVGQRLGDGVTAKPALVSTGPTATFGGKKVARHQRQGDGVSAAATGSMKLIDNQGMQFFINTDITFATTSSASGAVSEASFAGPVAASTMNGGTDQSALNDSYDGYNTLCISVNGTTGQCQTGSPNWTFYNNNGPAVPPLECNDRQVDFPSQAIGSLALSRKDYVPTDDHFIRFLNTVTNNGLVPQTVTLSVANNLGSDNNTLITGTSSGDTTATVADNWVTSFQNWSGTTSSDPRLGQVLQGPGAIVPVHDLSFVNGNDKPAWDYVVTLQPGQTANILNFGVSDATQAESRADAARLDALPPTALECLTPTETADIVNFAALPGAPTAVNATAGNASATVSFTPPAVNGSSPITSYTVTASPGGQTATGPGSPITVTGLTPGIPYTFTVVANNDGGSGPPSAPSGTVIPILRPTTGGGVAATPDGKGYWVVSPTGTVSAAGDATVFGSLTGKLAAQIVGIAATPDGKGYWLVGADGGVFAFGDASFFGSEGAVHLAQPVVGIASTVDGLGYWLVASDGGVFSFGDAAFHGSEGGIQLAQPVVGMAATPDGHGYWLVASDGGVFSHGDATFHGSEGAVHLAQPVVGLASTPDGLGYWMVAADGGVFSLGDATFFGSISGKGAVPTIGIIGSGDSKGYGIVTIDGKVTNFGDSVA
jgi:hypothetical protein